MGLFIASRTGSESWEKRLALDVPSRSLKSPRLRRSNAHLTQNMFYQGLGFQAEARITLTGQKEGSGTGR